MESVGFVVPIIPGKTDDDREAMRLVTSGERQADHVASRQRHGITREAVWLQPTPAGDVAVVYLEAHDVAAALAGLATSQDPFDVWFRETIKDIHGFDLAAGFPPPEQVVDYRANG